MQLLCLISGAAIGFYHGVQNALLEDLRELKPTLLVGSVVPPSPHAADSVLCVCPWHSAHLPHLLKQAAWGIPTALSQLHCNPSSVVTSIPNALPLGMAA